MLSSEICIKLRAAGLKQYQPQTFDKIYVRFRDEDGYRLGVIVPTRDPSFDGHLVVTDSRGAWPLATFVDHVRIPSADNVLSALWRRDEAALECSSFEAYYATIPGEVAERFNIERTLAKHYIRLYGKTE